MIRLTFWSVACARGSKKPRRRGTILAVTLVTMTLLLLLAAGLARTLVIYHRQAGVGEQQLQTLWLLESGIGRARQAAKASADYDGEVWNIPAETLTGESAGRVEIRVDTTEPSSGPRRATVEAVYPLEGSSRHILVQEISL